MQTVRALRPDLVMISEPYRHFGPQSWITDASKKTVIWACRNQPFQSITGEGVHNGFVKARVGGIYFYSCYAPPSLPLDEFTDFLDELTEDAKRHFPVAIAGDFNAWAVNWGSRETNPRGQAVLEAMVALDVVLLNSGDEPTFMRGDATSIVDLTFVSNTLAKENCSWRVTNIETASDHCEITWQANIGQRTALTPKKTNGIGWRVSTFDSSSYSAALDDRPISGSNATEKAQNIMRRLTEACDATMTRKRATNRHLPMYWWNETIATLRKECNAARRRSQRGRKKSNSEELQTRYTEARRNLSKAIKRSKKQSWRELLAEVESDTWGRPYKVVMSRLNSQPMLSPTCPVLLKKIVTVLFPQQPELHRTDEKWKEMIIPPITKQELMEACNRTAIHAMPEIFLDVYNECLREGSFPAMWKQ
ncbi:uncharacterized protein LOC107047681 [Diachasma alloeum]|uniref:uncharacterized protein LOC107047681 n=1 Tax=Diachasma alloeum TaxID=454923 RepID=UPI00073834F7|nr:uncharacterized protein LOC107047681 [Diachasma alloeum]